MISFNSPYISPESKKGIPINGYITVQAATDATGYNMQNLRRLLRFGKLEGIKIGQIWLIKMQSLETYLQHVENTSDHRCSPRKICLYSLIYECRH